MAKLSSGFMPGRQIITFSEQLQNAKGPILFNMTNDYMFRATLQKNKKVLKGLICACLHLSPNQIRSIEVTNPIQLGQQIEDKDFILDIKAILNNSVIMNLEMQVKNELNWPERSLTYLCRSFDQLQSGEDYWEAKPAVHIGFLCFAPFPENPEFFSAYRMMNIKTHHIYSDKLTLYVVYLSHIELATKEDKQWRIDYWASLFKAKTWEDLRMIAQRGIYG